MKIVYWPSMPLGRREIMAMIQGVADVELEVEVVNSLEAAARALPLAEGLIMSSPSPDEAAVINATLKGPHSLQWLHLVSAGTDGLSLCQLPPGLRTTHTPGATANAVGDHAMALLLALVRGLPAAWENQRAQRWVRIGPPQRITSLEGKTVVILGHGAIGQYLAKVLTAFGVSIRIVSRSPAQPAVPATTYLLDQLPEALKGADVLICAIALTDLTTGIVSESAMRQMNAGGFVVNVGRGPQLDQPGLLRCLRDGHLGGAGLDVTHPEPLPDHDELWSAPNLIITPHYAGAGSQQAGARIAAAAEAVLLSEIERQNMLKGKSNR